MLSDCWHLLELTKGNVNGADLFTKHGRSAVRVYANVVIKSYAKELFRMTEQQIIETLATKVMGWYWISDGRVNKLNGEEPTRWNPLQNIADAWMIVEKFKKGDPILRAKFAVLLPVLIYKLEPKDICNAALEVVA